MTVPQGPRTPSKINYIIKQKHNNHYSYDERYEYRVGMSPDPDSKGARGYHRNEGRNRYNCAYKSQDILCEAIR